MKIIKEWCHKCLIHTDQFVIESMYVSKSFDVVRLQCIACKMHNTRITDKNKEKSSGKDSS